MASESNILMGGFSKTNEIYYSDIETGQASAISHVYLGSNLIWQKTTSGSEAWYSNNIGLIFLVEYIPLVDITVSSFSMILSTSTSVYNYFAGIYTSAGAGVFYESGTAGVSIVNVGSLDTLTKYKHTKTISTDNPILSAGETYFIGLGERYTTYSALGDTSAADSNQSTGIYDWSTGGATVSPSPLVAADPVLFLEVIGV